VGHDRARPLKIRVRGRTFVIAISPRARKRYAALRSEKHEPLPEPAYFAFAAERAIPRDYLFGRPAPLCRLFSFPHGMSAVFTIDAWKNFGDTDLADNVMPSRKRDLRQMVAALGRRAIPRLSGKPDVAIRDHWRPVTTSTQDRRT
jgi:hypothetical protein